MDSSSSALPGQGTSPATLAELTRHLVARASLVLKRPPAAGRAKSAAPDAAKAGVGRVALVGAGPGDPELLTLRAARLIAEAEVLVFDHLVTADVLTLAAPTVERVYVGKKAGSHTLPQEDINQLLIRLAQSGRSVVRLKGGDPFVFGRGGEELEDLVAAGIPFEVVPGITAACGVAAYAGIPLTHRDHAQSVVFATGHVKPGGPDADWLALARPRQTTVIYMGVGAMGDLCAGLIAHGRGADTPAALVENGTTRAQRVVTGTLATLPNKARWAAVKPPALLIVGEVVALSDRLAWFSPRRLSVRS